MLGLPGESVMTLAPLAQEEGVTLFKRRAAAASNELDATDDASISTLVRLLDGLPLAIELAAARVRVMSPRVLLARMSDRFKLLASRSGRHERQATLRATLDWSWDLLTAAEKSALAQLSVFEGGFTLQAAEAVLDVPGLGMPEWTADLVQSLLEKSLVRRLGEHRFDLLLSVQEYAGQQLEATGGFPAAAAKAQMRHWTYFAALDEAQAITNGCADADNLIAACRRAAAASDAPGAAGALLGAWAVLALRGPYRAAVDLANVVLAIRGSGSGERARAAFVKASALFMLGRTSEALAEAERGLAILDASTDSSTAARLLCLRSEALTKMTRHEEALADLQRAHAFARALHEPSLQCKVLNALNVLALERGQLTAAREHCEAALRIAQAASDERWQGGLLGNLALLDYSEGRTREAIERYAQALELARRTGDRRWEGNARCNLGLLLHEQGRPAEAQAELEVALQIARTIGHSRLECTVLCNLGIVLESLRNVDAAHRCYEDAVRLAHLLGDRHTEGQFRAYLALSCARRGDFAAARESVQLGESLLRQSADKINLALLTCACSEVEHLAGNADGALAELRRAEALAQEANASANSELGRRIAALRECMNHA
ncbi:MAG: tetratricopeptide repeat protein [Burkholderiaceae bacterium]|nr:tetratricopeptide repeat protein [Burkholderiaceae bacterium]